MKTRDTITLELAAVLKQVLADYCQRTGDTEDDLCELACIPHGTLACYAGGRKNQWDGLMWPPVPDQNLDPPDGDPECNSCATALTLEWWADGTYSWICGNAECEERQWY
jgi:hypothetical protein